MSANGANGNGANGRSAERCEGANRQPAPWQVRIGANPIIWSNDDFRDLGGDITLERCLAEMQQAGYSGCELGHKFPKNTDTLSFMLDNHDLQLVSGWHSLHLLERTFSDEQRDFEKHLEFLQRLGSEVVIVAECSRRIYDDPSKPLHFDARESLLNEGEWSRLADGLERLAQIAIERGMTLAYHHHMGTVIQNRDEIDQLMRRTQQLRLLVDTGHLMFADADPLTTLETYLDRVAHVHLKNVRPNVLMSARAQRHSFSSAVREGVFTVPGDGGINFVPILEALRNGGYHGWLVVEAEQDPTRAQPLHYARMGFEYLNQFTRGTVGATGASRGRITG